MLTSPKRPSEGPGAECRKTDDEGVGGEMIISARSRSPSPDVGLSTRVVSSWSVERFRMSKYIRRPFFGDPGCEEDGDPVIGFGPGAEGAGISEVL